MLSPELLGRRQVEHPSRMFAASPKATLVDRESTLGPLLLFATSLWASRACKQQPAPELEALGLATRQLERKVAAGFMWLMWTALDGSFRFCGTQLSYLSGSGTDERRCICILPGTLSRRKDSFPRHNCVRPLRQPCSSSTATHNGTVVEPGSKTLEKRPRHRPRGAKCPSGSTVLPVHSSSSNCDCEEPDIFLFRCPSRTCCILPDRVLSLLSHVSAGAGANTFIVETIGAWQSI